MSIFLQQQLFRQSEIQYRKTLMLPVQSFRNRSLFGSEFYRSVVCNIGAMTPSWS